MCLQSVLGTMVPNMAQSACVGEVSSYVGVITSSVMSSDHEFNLLRYLCQILSPHPPPLSVLVPFLNPSLTLSLSLLWRTLLKSVNKILEMTMLPLAVQ